MTNFAILTALGFQPNEHNPFYTTFDPNAPEPPRDFFAGPERAPLEEHYRAYREAAAAALAKTNRAPEKVTMGLDRKALGHLARLLARLPEPDAFQGLGRFLVEWDENDDFDEFPDQQLETEIRESASDDADMWFNDLLETLKGFGFEFTDYSFDPYGYDNYLKGKVSGYYTKEILKRIDDELPGELAEVVRAFIFEAARYGYVDSLLEEPLPYARELLALVKKAKPDEHAALLLHQLAGDDEGFENRSQDLEAEDLVNIVDENFLLANKVSFDTRFSDLEDGYLHDDASVLQRALRNWLEKEGELDYSRRLDWLADRYDSGSLNLTAAVDLGKAA